MFSKTDITLECVKYLDVHDCHAVIAALIGRCLGLDIGTNVFLIHTHNASDNCCLLCYVDYNLLTSCH